jgi:hypothetical protein
VNCYGSVVPIHRSCEKESNFVVCLQNDKKNEDEEIGDNKSKMSGPSSSDDAAASPLSRRRTTAANDSTSSTAQSPLMHHPPSEEEGSIVEPNDPVVIKSINTRSLNKNIFTPELHKKKDRAGRISDKLYAACWVGAGIGTGYFSKFWHVMTLQDDRILFWFYFSAMILLATNIVLALYLTIYIPHLLELNIRDKDGPSIASAWKAYCPNILPIMSVNGVLCGCFLIRATWPIWHVLSPLILAVEFISIFFSTHFIPWC